METGEREARSPGRQRAGVGACTTCGGQVVLGGDIGQRAGPGRRALNVRLIIHPGLRPEDSGGPRRLVSREVA